MKILEVGQPVHCILCKAEAKEAERLASLAFKAEKDKLLEEYPTLKVHDGQMSPSKLAAVNIRSLLKKEFPCVKFSVTSDYSSINVRWEDGPTGRRVKKITSKFNAGHVNSMEGIYKSHQPPWNALFGSAEYLNEERSLSNEHLEFCLDKLYEHFAADMANIERRPVNEMRGDRSLHFPNVDIEVGTVLNAIARAWDPLTESFDPEAPLSGSRWVVEHILAHENASAPAPGI
ncbi:MAG: LPD29 domain-containing protein [Sideroxyarcus sp.]|nr:LPD29 domain-containing protein [Sideroxyarcus sp.]